MTGDLFSLAEISAEEPKSTMAEESSLRASDDL